MEKLQTGGKITEMDTERYTITDDNVLIVKDGVWEIRDYEFEGFDKIKKVVLPRTVSSIGHMAFEDCKSLKSINIPAGVKYLDAAFWGCSSLTEIDLPDGLEKIGRETFADCIRLKKVRLPYTLKIIYNDAFRNCKSLKQIIVPSTTEIHRGGLGFTPFTGCDALEKVIIRDIEPYFSKTEVQRLVLVEQPQYYCPGCSDEPKTLYGVVFGAEPGEDVTAYVRQLVKDLLFERFRHSAAYLDWEEDRDFGHAQSLEKLMEYDKQRFAVVDMYETSPDVMQIEGRTYLIDGDFYRSLLASKDIEWIPLV